MRKPGMLITVAVIVFLSALMEGCVFYGDTHVIEEPFTEKQVNNIHNGQTTKKDVLRWFGPPLVAARPGNGSAEILAESLFERFEVLPVRPQMPLSYYYKSTVSNWAGVGPIHWPPFTLGRTATVRELWILIDEKSGMVVDHRMEKTVDGKLQQETGTNAAGSGIP